MSKVTVVGAGNVGATCANVIATREIADELVLLDIKEGVSEGKMLDIFQTATLMDFDTKLTGVTNDYAATADSDVVVVTSGMPRKPGMTREELIGVNAGIVASVVGNVLKYSPKAVILMISNPMDTMTYLALKKSGLPKNQIFGMGGAQAGDVVYVLKPEYMAEHGYGLPTGESGCGSLKNLLMFRGPNIRKGYRYTRPRWLADIVPTLCYMTGGPVPEDAEGAPIYQIMEDPNMVK